MIAEKKGDLCAAQAALAGQGQNIDNEEDVDVAWFIPLPVCPEKTVSLRIPRGRNLASPPAACCKIQSNA